MAASADGTGTLQPLERKLSPGGLTDGEIYWRDHQKWLQSVGYLLRPRYEPNWVPSWRGKKEPWINFEDGHSSWRYQIMDATRISDGAFVSLKQVEKSLHPYETAIATYLSSEPLRSDPANHSVPILKLLQVPDDEDIEILVMPFLREYGSPRFDTFGECVDFIRQIFEGMHFLHKHHVAHRDCNPNNIMMDPSSLFPESFHPVEKHMRRDFTGKAKHYTRTQRPTQYYLIDFAISRRYAAEDIPALEVPIWGGDKSVPEFHKSNNACDPFPTDVYYLGNTIRNEFLLRNLGFEFLEKLVVSMVQSDPAKRPTMEQVVTGFDEICRSLSSWKLRSRVVRRKDSYLLGFFRGVAHWNRRIGFVIRRIPALPSP